MAEVKDTNISIDEIWKATALSEKDKKLVEKAYNFAKEAHKNLTRHSGEPYFNHLFATAKYLAELGLDGESIAAGFLHDTIEDVGVDKETIKKEFGDEVLFIIEGVTKLGHVRYHGSDRHNESLRKLFVAVSQDMRVILVKLCDRLHNMETLEFVPKEKQLRIAKETLEIYVPIAYRLGIRKLSRRLEDLAFPYVFPQESSEIKKLIKEKFDSREESLDKFRKSLSKELAKSSLRDFKTEYRVKGKYSLYKKYLKYKKEIDKIFDIAAVRILLPKVEDCYKVLGIIHSNFQPMPGRIKDFIAFPKTNGYRGIHTTVFTGDGSCIEVQIKTYDMHNESEYGIASHMNYKTGKSGTLSQSLEWIKSILPQSYFKKNEDRKEYKGIPDWIKDLVEYQSNFEDSDSVISDIKSDFLNEQIFVFTPKGDVVDLPKGSCAIDFAYAIHSDIGDHISGAIINGKMSGIDTPLSSGDIVDIQTSKNSKPKRKWLEFVKTTLAKRSIRNQI